MVNYDYLSSTAAAAGAKNISLTVNYVKFDDTTAAAVDFHFVNFEGTEVDPELRYQVTYKTMDTAQVPLLSIWHCSDRNVNCWCFCQSCCYLVWNGQ